MPTVKKYWPAAAAPPRRKRVAAYARVSDGKDSMLHSLSAQVSFYSGYIQKQRGWEYAGVYTDEALTGTKENRPGFQRMLKDCRAGKIDLVITKSIARFARNTVTLLEVVRELKTLGVDIWFERENIHSISGDGELMLTILASYAQEESRSVSENCRWRIQKDFQKGKPVTVQMYGYRIQKGNFQIVPEEAEVVRRIFSLCLEGFGRYRIARMLNEEKVPSRFNKRWNDSTIGEILANEKYTGDLLLQKTFVSDHLTKTFKKNRGELARYHVPDNHEPIVSRKTFEKVQEIIAERARRFHTNNEARKRYPFTGMIRCGICGQHFKRKVTHGKNAWNCSAYLKHGKSVCHAKQIPEDTLMAVAAEVLGLAVFDEAVFKERVAEMFMPGDNRVVFTLRNGCVVEKVWQDKSRRDSWSEEMRQAARERRLENNKRRNCNDE